MLLVSIQVFMKGMVEQKILRPENIEILFSNLANIIEVNEVVFLKKIKERKRKKKKEKGSN